MSHRIGPPQPKVWYDPGGWWSWECPRCGDFSAYALDTAQKARKHGQKHLRAPGACPGIPWWTAPARPF